ncbi:probable long-chain-alcohol O-fatty-acyltransferase 2 [Gossypium arboreum]|uniref:probable long-chain-alcohol O-fatty-acyltransferase 2 n=1 Tax=Gossypium arboreum TaxID=29729 RepID=UPI0022F15C26|nr:probable long-chain-alcohol O-fatty-acyltransferase 2 [Gossypium arboreum]
MFFLSWMANFKLLLFAFDKAPLSSFPSKPHLFILTAFVATIPVEILLASMELEPQFKAPVRATSLQDFWGHRLNLRVSNILHSAICSLVKSISTLVIRSRWASLPITFATFVTSSLMYEMIYYNIIYKSPTWKVTWFFILQ